MCNHSVTLRWEKLDTGGVALKTLRHSSAALGDNIYVYGGILNGTPTDDLMMFNTGEEHTDPRISDQSVWSGFKPAKLRSNTEYAVFIKY